jgi:hypothetical protein
MPITYSNSYVVTDTGTTVPGGGTLYQVQVGVEGNSYTHTDAGDGSFADDEALEVGESVVLIEDDSSETVVGTFVAGTDDGGIIYDQGGTLIWRTNVDSNETGGPLVEGFARTTEVCFAAGTRIATPDGERAVETLAIGDPILTADGRTVPVKWIGRQILHKLFTPVERFEPVRVAAGALGDGLPRRDLVLTADHALLVGGILANASALVNGTTITRVAGAELPDRVTYYHVETEGHEMILAEGAPAETFVDHQSRRLFDNYAEYVDLYGGERRSIPESDLPRVTSPRQLPAALRSRLAPLMSA